MNLEKIFNTIIAKGQETNSKFMGWILFFLALAFAALLVIPSVLNRRKLVKLMHEREVLKKEKELAESRKVEEITAEEIANFFAEIQKYESAIKEKNSKIQELENKKTEFTTALSKLEDWTDLD